ncbi:MAG: VRR-NUC domain-containing protein [Clostridiales bacterium]|nr:VRR-NUC domain-containing protein [Clostridiales bacterium]
MAAEKLFENRIKKYLHSAGVYPVGFASDRMEGEPIGWYTKIWGGGYQKSGIPDLICCINGIFIAVEVKASNGRPSELQRLNIKRINKSGGIGLFLYPEGFEEFKNLIKGVTECNIHTAELSALISANSSTKCAILTE